MEMEFFSYYIVNFEIEKGLSTFLKFALLVLLTL